MPPILHSRSDVLIGAENRHFSGRIEFLVVTGEMPQFGCGKTLSTYSYTALETARLEMLVLWPRVEMKSP